MSLGPYVVERKLPGAGYLYLAHDPRAGVDAMVELMYGELSATMTSAARGRLLRDARTLSTIEHRGIVRILMAGEHEEIPWVAMEVVRGTDLERLLAERGAVPSARALRWISEAVEAVRAAHDAFVVHRALEPSNLFVTHDDEIRVKGFGMGSRAAAAYASPELLEHGLADERSDVWALGCVLFELCVGTPPFGRGGPATEVAIAREEPIFPPQLASAVVEVITSCLRKSSFARVASMRELRSLLRDAQETAGAGPERTSERLRAARPHLTSAPPSMQSDSGTQSGTQSGTSRAELGPPPQSSTPLMGTTGSAASVARMRSSIPPRHPTSSTALRIGGGKGNVKGTALRPAIAWFSETYGADAVARVYDLASTDLKSTLHAEDLGSGIIASGWYDTFRTGEMLTILEKVADPADSDAYNNALAGAISRDNVAGVYRALFRLVTTPELLEANIQRVWRTYCDEGTLIAKVSKPGHVAFEVTGWNRHHTQVCRVFGFVLQQVLRGVGYRGMVIERTRCVGSGDSDCGFEGNYLP